MFAASAFVFVGGHLTTGDIQLFHEFTCQPTADLYPEAIGHDGRDTSGASIAAAGVPRFFDPAAFNHSLSIGFTSPAMPMLVAAAMNVKNQAQRRNRISRSKIVDYRKSLSESDIKSAVVDSIGQCNSHVKTCSCGGLLDETDIYSKGKSICF